MSSLRKTIAHCFNTTYFLKWVNGSVAPQTPYTKIHRHEEELGANALSISESDRSLGETCVGFRSSLEKFDEFSREQQASIVEYDRLSAKLKEKIAEYEIALLELSHNPRTISATDDIASEHDLQLDIDQSIKESVMLCDRLEQEIANRTSNKYHTHSFNDEALIEKRRTLSCQW